MLFPLLRIAVGPPIVCAHLRASVDLPETLAMRPEKIQARVSLRGQKHYARGLPLKATNRAAGLAPVALTPRKYWTRPVRELQQWSRHQAALLL
jgi:hypothetical protein